MLEAMPAGYRAIGTSANTPLCAVAHESKPIFGIQFHPEVTHTQHGTSLLLNFLHACGMKLDWNAGHFIDEKVAEIRALADSRWLDAERAAQAREIGVDGLVCSAEEAAALLKRHGVEIIEGPSPRRTSDNQPAKSVYFRDPDQNLIEFMAAD